MGKTYDNVENYFSLKLFSLSLYIMLFIVFSQEQEDNIIKKKKKVKAHMIQRPTWPELILISLAWSMPRSIATPPGWDASPSQGYPPAVCRQYPCIYTREWRETKWSKVPRIRKQRDGRGLNPGPPHPEFEVLTAQPHTPLI